MNYGVSSLAFPSCLLPIQLGVIYVREDQVARKRTRGCRGLKGRYKFPSVWAVTPGRPRGTSLTTAGDWGDTHSGLTLKSDCEGGGGACVHSFLMTDETVNCGQLVRVTLTLRLGCAKHCLNTKMRWGHFHTVFMPNDHFLIILYTSKYYCFPAQCILLLFVVSPSFIVNRELQRGYEPSFVISVLKG